MIDRVFYYNMKNIVEHICESMITDRDSVILASNTIDVFYSNLIYILQNIDIYDIDDILYKLKCNVKEDTTISESDNILTILYLLLQSVTELKRALYLNRISIYDIESINFNEVNYILLKLRIKLI